MNPPDEVAALPLLIEPSLEQYLREFLSDRHSIAEVELADTVVLYLRGGERYAVFDEGNMWVYEPENGVFVRLEAADIANALYDLDGTPLAPGPYRVTNARANAVIRVVRHRLTESGFFASAPKGVAVANGFLEPLDDGIQIRPCSCDQRQRWRLPIPYEPEADTDIIDRFMDDTFDDPELVQLVYELIGVAIFGFGTHYQTSFVFH